MLKVIYSETGQYLEHTSSAMTEWLAQQRQLASHIGDELIVESCTAAILLPASYTVMAELTQLVAPFKGSTMEWSYVDADMIEVVLCGLWVSSFVEGHEGTFLVDMSDLTALALMQLWADAARQMSTVSR
ncbi:MAG: alr0857 family protein [Cyanobacteria bacterium J06626_14]